MNDRVLIGTKDYDEEIQSAALSDSSRCHVFSTCLRSTWSLVLFIWCSVGAFGQNQVHEQPVDTTRATVKHITSNALFDNPVQKLPLIIELTESFDDARMFGFGYNTEIPNVFSRREIEKIDLAKPWKLQLARENEHRTLYSILGAVEAGGVAYLAYKHIQKYGWK